MTLFDPPGGRDWGSGPDQPDDSWGGDTRHAEELLVNVDGLTTEGVHTGLFIVSQRDSQNTHRHTVLGIAEDSAFSAAELKQEDEILRVDDKCVYGQKPRTVQEALRGVLRRSLQETIAFTLTVRRPNKGDYSSGHGEFLEIKLTVRVNILRMETARVFASRQNSQVSGYGGVLFRPNVVGTDHDTVSIHLRPKYQELYISFNRHAQNKLPPITKKRGKDVFNRTRYVGYDVGAKRPVFVVTLELRKRPGYYLAVQGSEVVLKRYATEANPHMSIDHAERFFVIRKIEQSDLYESLRYRHHYVSYENRALKLRYHRVTSTERPPDSIVFAQEYSDPEITSGSSIIFAWLSFMALVNHLIKNN